MIAEIIIIQGSGIDPVQAAAIVVLTVALTILFAFIIETWGNK